MSLLNKLSAYWSMEETASPSIDGTGRANDLTWNLASSAPGYKNNGIYLINGNSYLTCPSSSDVQPGVRESFTIAGWFKPDSVWVSHGTDSIICVKENTYRIGLSAAFGQHVFFTAYYNGGNVTVTVPFTPGEDWFFWRAWRDADTDLIWLQINCGDPVSAAFDFDLYQNSFDFFLGGAVQAGPTYEYTAGTQDMVGFWLRVLDTGEADLLCAGLEYPFGVCGVIQYGDYEFSNTWYPAEEGVDWSPAVSPLARADGGRALDFFTAPRRLLIRGGEIYGPLDHTSLRTRLDDIKAALALQPQNLFFRPDRYWRDVRVEYFRNPYGPTHYCRIAIDMEVSFLCRDPFQYALLGSSDTWSAPTTGNTNVLTAGGNIYALPEFAFTVGGAGAQTIDWTLTNSTTGEAFQLTGDVTGGQVINVSSLDKTVLIGTTDEIALFDGQFPTMQLGDNTFTITIAAGTITTIVTTWRDRYL